MDPDWAALVGDVVDMHDREGRILRIGAAEALGALVVHGTGIAGGLVRMRGCRGAAVEVGLPAVHLVDDLLCVLGGSEYVTDDFDGLEDVFGEHLVLIGDADDGDVELGLQSRRIPGRSGSR